MEGVLHALGPRYVGILNGIDTNVWNPSTDPWLPASYDVHDLSGKVACKRALLERFKLPVGDDAIRRPIVGMVSRLVDQKGLDLVDAAKDALLAMDATWVFVGTGEAQVRSGAPSAGRAAPGARRRLHRLRREPRAPGRGRRRHVPDAVEVRAVRAESDVQPAVRHRADRPRGGRAGRHDPAVHVARASRQRVQVS